MSLIVLMMYFSVSKISVVPCTVFTLQMNIIPPPYAVLSQQYFTIYGGIMFTEVPLPVPPVVPAVPVNVGCVSVVLLLLPPVVPAVPVNVGLLTTETEPCGVKLPLIERFPEYSVSILPIWKSL
jgi:hypothetical protein